MQIWIDADACPKPVKEILYRAAERLKTPLLLVANRPLAIPASRNIRSMVVGSGLDVADATIVRLLQPGDLVITADIPLAALVVDKGGYALNPRGELYDQENIKERLALRDFMDELRGSGVDTGGPAPFNQQDRTAFANQLDRFLTSHRK